MTASETETDFRAKYTQQKLTPQVLIEDLFGAGMLAPRALRSRRSHALDAPTCS
jgi:hypothetical protein